MQKALARLRSTNKPAKQEGADRGQQRTLESVWREMLLPPGDGMDWTQEHEDPDTFGVRAQLRVLQGGAVPRSKKRKTEEPAKTVEKPKPTQVDHEAATQRYIPPRQHSAYGRPSSIMDYDVTTQDEQETERWARQQWQEEYGRLEQEEQAEAEWLAERQEEIEVEAVWESYERANDQNMGRATHLDTESEQDEWGDSD